MLLMEASDLLTNITLTPNETIVTPPLKVNGRQQLTLYVDTNGKAITYQRQVSFSDCEDSSFVNYDASPVALASGSTLVSIDPGVNYMQVSIVDGGSGATVNVKASSQNLPDC